MPSQAHLFIGERVATEDEVRDILIRIGANPSKIDADPDVLCNGWDSSDIDLPPRHVIFRGQTFEVEPQLILGGEDASIPAQISTMHPCLKDDTWALVGFPLTSRYQGFILDVDYVVGGRPEPFEIDLEAAADILRQTREWWPNAKLLIMDLFY